MSIAKSMRKCTKAVRELAAHIKTQITELEKKAGPNSWGSGVTAQDRVNAQRNAFELKCILEDLVETYPELQ